MKKTLPKKGELPHWNSGVIFCCNTPTASPWDSLEVKNTKKRKIVNCIACRGQFILSWVQLTPEEGGLHVAWLSQ